MVGIDSKSEIEISQPQVLVEDVTQRFETLFTEVFEEEKIRDGEGDPTHATYRSLRRVLNSEEFNEKEITNEEAKQVANFLLSKRKYSKEFKELINYHKNSLEFGDLSRNARRVYAGGKGKIR